MPRVCATNLTRYVHIRKLCNEPVCDDHFQTWIESTEHVPDFLNVGLQVVSRDVLLRHGRVTHHAVLTLAHRFAVSSFPLPVAT